MGEPQVKFGDRFFVYGQFLCDLKYFGEYEYNSVMGYMTVGGYLVTLKETDTPGASVPGFLIDSFDMDVELVDVTDKLALSLPFTTGSKVWMPVL